MMALSDNALAPAHDSAAEVTLEKMVAADARMRGSRVLLGAGPIDAPCADDLRAAVARIAHADSRRRLVRRVDNAGNWRVPSGATIDAWARDVVVELDESENVSAELTELAARYDAEYPVRVFAGTSRVVVLVDHASSDGLINGNLLGAIVGVARGGDVPALFTEPDTSQPYRRAVRATFGSLTKVRAFLRQRREGSRPLTPALATVEPAGDLTAPALTSVSVTMPAPAFRAVRAWGKAQGASFASTEAVLYRRALAAEGLHMAPFTSVVADLRRYLPEGDRVTGNFVSGQYVYNVDDAAALSAEMNDALRVGRPLAVAAFTALRGLVRGGRTPHLHAPSSVVTPGLTTLLVSSLGPLRAYDGLPWTVKAGDGRVATCCMDVESPHMVSTASFIVGGELHITASFDARFHNPDVIARAMERTRQAPLDLLA